MFASPKILSVKVQHFIFIFLKNFFSTIRKFLCSGMFPHVKVLQELFSEYRDNDLFVHEKKQFSQKA